MTQLLDIRPNAASRRPVQAAFLVALSAVMLSTTGASAQQAISPMSRAGMEGSSSTSFPLGRYNMRLQQLHDDVPMSTLPVLSAHAYRRDAISTRGAIGGFQVDMQVEISMAQSSANSPSSTFANNRGSQPLTVLPRTVLSFPPSDRPLTSPAPAAEFFIPYAVPFVRPSDGTLCVETVIFGNEAPTGTDRNFNASLDAHVLEDDGTTRQLGYRYGTGCAAASQSRSHEGRFEFLQTPTDLLFTIDSQFGVPSVPGGPAFNSLVLGDTQQQMAWPAFGACSTWTNTGAVIDLPGNSDMSGDWDITYSGLDPAFTGLDLYLQLFSANPTTGEYSMSEGSFVTIPGLEANPRQASRIAASTNRDATAGTVSFNVPVTQFF